MREEFDLDPSVIYLNSGTHSIAPRRVVEAANRFRHDYERNPTEGHVEVWGRLWDVQKRLAEFFRADPADLFLRANITTVMNNLILGAPLSGEAGGEILLSELEYGAIANICRFRAERDGLRIRTFGLPVRPEEFEDLNEDGLAALVLRELRPETRMLVVSHIMTGTGLVLPIAKIAHETRKRGVLLAVDGAHSAGALELDFSRLEDVDYYGANLHKWMLGPKGTSFGWVSKRHQASLRPVTAGWCTFETLPFLQAFGEGSRFTARMVAAECYDFSSTLAIPEALEFWRRHGAAAIRARILTLQNAVAKSVEQELRWQPLSPPEGTLRGPLLTFEPPAHLQALDRGLMFRLSRECGLQLVVTYVRGKPVVRFSPHVYNTIDEIERAVVILKQFSASL